MRFAERFGPRGGYGLTPAYLVAVLLAGAFLFGGGGAEGPLNNGVIQAASVSILLVLIAQHWQGRRPLREDAILPVGLLAGLLLIGLAQVIPLPPAAWHGLPGRDLAESSLRLASAADGWRPLSLDPEATRRSMAALLLPAALMLAALSASLREVQLWLRTLIGCALISSVIGALQLALDYPAILTFYGWNSSGAAAGVFANPNHQATFLVAAIVAVGLTVRLKSEVASARGVAIRFDPTWLAVPVLAAMTLAANSRAAALLLVLAIPASAAVGIGFRPQRLWLGALALLCLVGLAFLILGPAGLALFSDDKRTTILPDILYTLTEHWPWGSGFGTFSAVFAANENLDFAGRHFVNHAHNDILEFLVDSGVAGALWIGLAAAAVVAMLVIRHWRGRSSRDQAFASWSGFVILALILLHSLVDYPLRTCSVAAVGGLALGLVFARPRQHTRHPPVSTARFRWAFAIAVPIGLILGAQTIRIYAAQAAVRAGDGATAVAIRPQNGSGLALAAEEELARHRYKQAKTLAHEAIVASPLSVRAVRVLAIAEDLDRRAGAPAWQVASGMGWRDPPTQYWAMQQALANGEYETAAIRADAFLRTAFRGLQDRIELVRAATNSDPFRKQFERRLMQDPPWRAAFFRVSSAVPDQQLQGVHKVLQDLADSRRRPPIDEAAGTLRALIERKRYAQAVALYQAVSGAGALNSMTDLRFDKPTDHYTSQKNPFSWSFRANKGSVTSVEPSGNRRVLVLGTDGRRHYQPARKYSALKAGTYQLGYAMRGPAESPSTLGISIYCMGVRQPLATSSTEPLRSSGFERRQITFAVPQSCQMLALAFEARPADRGTQAEFADLALRPI